MKNIIFTTILAASFSTFAANVHCVSSTTGQKYEVNIDEGSLKIRSPKGRLIYEISPLEVHSEVVALYPLKTVTTLSYPDRGDVIFELNDETGRLTGYFHQDENMSCEYRN